MLTDPSCALSPLFLCVLLGFFFAISVPICWVIRVRRPLRLPGAARPPSVEEACIVVYGDPKRLPDSVTTKVGGRDREDTLHPTDANRPGFGSLLLGG